MKKNTQGLNLPAKIGIFAAVAVILVAAVAFGSMHVGAGANANKTIGLDKGVAVALQDSGFSAEQVSGLRAHYDSEDGNAVYEVEFVADGFEYDYTIKASDGKIIEAARERADEVFQPAAEPDKVQEPADQQPEENAPAVPEVPAEKPAEEPASKYIGVDKAKSVALKDAGLSASGVTFTKAKLDKDDGVAVYEVEFFKGNTEYDYEINAVSGKIRDKDIDVEDDWDDDWDD